MTERKNKKRGRKRQKQSAVSGAAKTGGISPAAFVGGIVLLLGCIFTSLMLALEHFGGLHLPGCGVGSGCAEAAASVWGKVPYLNWPVSFVGLGYFLGLLFVWLRSRRGITAGVRNLVRLGVLISAGFVIVMIVEGHVCQYCMATHACNFLLWIVVERTGRAASGTFQAAVTLATVFIISSATLGAVEWRVHRQVQAQAESDLGDSITQIVKGNPGTGPKTQTPIGSPGETGQASTVEIGGAPSQPATTPAANANNNSTSGATHAATTQSARKPQASEVANDPADSECGFTGRYRLGPEKAAVRIVAISDYQCPVCRHIERDIERVIKQHDDVAISFSFKHFPRNPDCNRTAKMRAHSNACWAARAAEAAGILGGNDGFWQMHFWLFENKGSFTNATLEEALQRFGYDPQEFVRTMISEKTLELVKEDVEQAVRLGVYQTPTIFINGVELRGWNAPNAIERAVQQLAATDPPLLTAENDCPPLGLEKLIGDWLNEREVQIPPTPAFRTSGPEDAAVRIVIFGEFQHDGSAGTDRVVRELVADRDDVRYEYRYYPFNKDCNPGIRKETLFPHGCRAAQAAEAAGRIAGSEGYWKMHAWLFEHQEPLEDEALEAAASAVGIDLDQLLAEMAKPEVSQVITEDAVIGQRCGVTAVPSVFVNGRRVPRWSVGEKNNLPEIIDAAANKQE